MSGLSTGRVVHEQDFRDISSTKLMPLGTVAETDDGRRFRYALNGAVALAPGKVTVAAAVVANHINRTVSTSNTVGSTQVGVNVGATAVTANQYADGYLVMNDAAGEGINYKIENHTTHASGSAAITVNLSDPVKVALTASTSEASLIANPWSAIIIAPGAIAHRPVGVPNVDVTASYYCWVQTRGDCAVLSDGVVTKGAQAILSDAVNGAVEIRVDATVVQPVGFAPEATVDTEYRTIVLGIE